MRTGTMTLKIKDGKVDKKALEQFIKRKIPGYQRYEFVYNGNKVWIKAWKEGMPKGKVALCVFQFFTQND